MITAILVLVILIGLCVASICVKVEHIERKYVRTIKVYRYTAQVDTTIKELEAKGWVYTNIKPVESHVGLYEITFVK